MVGDNYVSSSIIILFYKYVKIDDVDYMIDRIRQFACPLIGRVLVASEGINGTLSGNQDDINLFIKKLEEEDSRFCGIDWKTSISPIDKPFPDLFIKKCNEIIGVGHAKDLLDKFIQFDPTSFSGISDDCVGNHLTPEEWHKKLQFYLEQSNGGDSNENKDYLLIDVRNEIESNVGYFESATPIGSTWYSETFKTLDDILEKNNILEEGNNKPIMMYCTGGIRCEKASAYLMAKGVSKDRCFQLKGGIHRYLEKYPNDSLFKGKNFVFDSRILVKGDSNDNVNETPTCSDNVVGKCINCSGKSDNLSGSIVCTVCRAVIIVCPTCVKTNPHPGEYHCSRHQFLKHCYFTVLELYTPSELHQQIQDLNIVHDTVLNNIKVDKNRRKTVRRQIEKIQERLKILENDDNKDLINSYKLKNYCKESEINILPELINEIDIIAKSENICYDLAANGLLELLMYAHKYNGYVWTNGEEITNIAAYNGHLNCLKYAHENGCPWVTECIPHQEFYNYDAPYPFDDDEKRLGERRLDSICDVASKKGHLDCLKYSNEKDCDWSIERCVGTFALKGYLDCLKYAYEENDCPLNLWICHNAAIGGQLECLKYAHENGCPWDYWTCYEAAENGQLECLKYAHENGCPWGELTCNVAAEKGNLECLKYAHENGCLWDEQTCSKATDNLECLKYAHENGCPWDDDCICIDAAMNGNLECLKYAHENGCPWDEKTCSKATYNLECLKYAHENGCPWDEKTTRGAAKNGKLECLKYAHENGCPWNEKTTRGAARYEKLECLKYAHENGCPWNEETTSIAAEFNNLECLKYAYENGCPLDKENICTLAEENDSLDCLEYLINIINGN